MTKRLLHLFILLAMFALPKLSHGVDLLNEPFTYGVTPSGWTQDSAGVTPFYVWAFNNPHPRVLKGSSDTTYAIFDSDHYLSGNSQNCYLNIPSMNASALSTVLIVMKEVFRSYAASYHQIEVSVNAGTSWTPILADSVSNVGGIDGGSITAPDTLVTNVYDISTIAAGQADLRIRLHYVGTWGYYWIIDNIVVTDFYACNNPPTAGQTVSSRAFSCNTDSFLLSLSHNTSGSGQSYQWRNSTDGLTWSDLVGDTANTALVSQSGPMYYQCILTCGLSSKNSDSVLVSNNPVLGSALSTDPYTCDPTHVLSLTLYPVLPNYGQTYQWESSSDGLTWSAIGGATSDSSGVTQSTATYYHCVFGCETTNISSDSVFVDTHPDPGTTLCTDYYVCNPAQNISLSISNVISVTGITYTWESSTDGTTWTPIPGANASTTNANQSAGTYYHCVVGCGLSSGPSTDLYVGNYNLPGLTCYCLPQSGSVCSGDYISNVTIVGTSMNNNTTCLGTPSNNYTFMPPVPAATANLTRGMTYSLSITTSSDNIISMWIDYNADGVYDASEWAQVCTSSTAAVATTISFTVPLTAYVGEVGMRIRSRAFGNINGAVDACTGFGSGEGEDYIIGIETNVGLNTLNSTSPFLIVPNPSSGLTRITVGPALFSNAVLKVMDVLGNELQHTRILNTSQVDLDLSAFANGIYFINIANDKDSQTRRLIINR